MNTELPHYRLLIESALAYASSTHTFDDVVREVEAGTAQFWPGPTSVIVTQVDDQPSRKILLFFLGAGTSAEIRVMMPLIEAWGVEQGCSLARVVGRKGWARVLADDEWVDKNLVVLEKEL